MHYVTKRYLKNLMYKSLNCSSSGSGFFVSITMDDDFGGT